jgi:hypothetical protein
LAASGVGAKELQELARHGDVWLKERFVLKGHTEAVWCVAFTPDGTHADHEPDGTGQEQVADHPRGVEAVVGTLGLLWGHVLLRSQWFPPPAAALFTAW